MTEFIFAAVILGALLLAGLVGTVESALSATSSARVDAMLREEEPGASRLKRVVDHRADHINLLVLLHTVLSVTAAVFAAALFSRLIASSGWAFAVAIASVAFLSFVVVGVFSRTVGRKNPYRVTMRAAVLLRGLDRIFGPVVRLLIRVGNSLAPGRGFVAGPYAGEVEFREMVDIAQDHGVVEVQERRMIQNIFDLASTTARQVMVPRTDMVWIESDKSAGQATRLSVRSGYSRLPIVGESVDDIVGVVYLKDLVARTYHMTDGGRSVTVTDLMRPAAFVPDSVPLDVLLHDMQTRHNHLAMLVDEYGGIAGLITMEDILEEIVGEITDEYDADDDPPFEQVGPRAFRVQARVSLDDLAEEIEEAIGYELRFDQEIDDQVDTVGGLVAFAVGRVPLPGTTTRLGDLTMTAEGGNNRRGRLSVRTVLVEVAEPDESPPGEDERAE